MRRWLLILVACGGSSGSDDEQKDAAHGSGMCTPGQPCAPMSGGCCRFEKCGWIVRDDGSLDRIMCVPAGGVAVGEACAIGPIGPGGYSNCVRNTECVGGTCKPMCSQVIGCSGTSTCVVTPGFEPFGVC